MFTKKAGVGRAWTFTVRLPGFVNTLLNWTRAFFTAFSLFSPKGVAARVLERLRRGGIREIRVAMRDFVASKSVPERLFTMRVPGFLSTALDWGRAITIALRTLGFRGLMRHVVARFRRGGMRDVLSSGHAFVVNQVVARRADIAADRGSAASRPVPRRGSGLPQKAGRPPASGQLRLQSDRSIELSGWEGFVQTLAGKHLPAHDQKDSRRPQRLVTVIDCENGAANGDWRLTAASIEKLAQTAGAGVTVCFSRETHRAGGGTAGADTVDSRELLGVIEPDDLVLWIKAGDVLNPETKRAIAHYMSSDAEFALLDMYWVEDDVAHPLLFNGVDPVQAESVCYFMGRFAARGRQIERLLRGSPDSSSEDLGRRLAMRRDLRSIHIPLPMIRARIDRDAMDALRRRAVEDVGRRRAGVRHASVSAVICTKNSGLLLEQLTGQLLLNPAIKDLVVVANAPTNAYAQDVIRDIAQRPRCTVVDFPGEFNFSKQSNLGARKTEGEHLLFINDDIAPVKSDWLERLLDWMDGPRIAGPLLVYPDQSIQHAGMFLGFNGVAGHALRGGTIPDCDPDFMLSAPRLVSALTGALMLMPREVFEDLNGFDVMLGTYLQDVDLCMRATRRGIDLVFDPRSILIHMESVSVKPVLGDERIRRRREREFDYFLARWGDERLHDPHLHPLIDQSDETLTLLNT